MRQLQARARVKLFRHGLSRTIFLGAVGLALILLAETDGASPASAQTTSFPTAYLPLLTFNGVDLQKASSTNQGGNQTWIYQAAEKTITIRVDSLPCTQNVCPALLDSIFKGLYQIVAQTSGKFDSISPSEVQATWNDAGSEVHHFAFVMPGSLLVWSLSKTDSISPSYFDQYRQSLMDAVNRERFDVAQALGSIDLGHFDNELREYAERLLKKGEKTEALKVLQAVISTAPRDYKAQLEFASNTADSAAARTSASIVFENAETPQLLTDSAAILHVPYPDEAAPLLQKNDKGLQIILIPLAPCDDKVLEAAGQVFTQITGVPAKIRRLEQDWVWHSADRFPNQRTIQQLIVENRHENVNFANWGLAQYESELIRISNSADPITRYRVNQILSQSDGPGAQYDVGRYLDVFSKSVAPFRSSDPRTVYIGVTDVNISLGDANYVVDAAMRSNPGVSLASYYMMTAGPSGEAFESRSRLATRLGKQLVPPLFGALGIPQSVDPNDPSSYANGIAAIDQKSVVLSQSSKDALDKFR